MPTCKERSAEWKTRKNEPEENFYGFEPEEIDDIRHNPIPQRHHKMSKSQHGNVWS